VAFREGPNLIWISCLDQKTWLPDIAQLIVIAKCISQDKSQPEVVYIIGHFN